MHIWTKIHFTISSLNGFQFSQKAHYVLENHLLKRSIFRRTDDGSVIQINLFIWSPCLIWHKGREVTKQNDKYVFYFFLFHYSDDTTLRIHRLSVKKRLFLSILASRIASQQTIHGIVVRSKSLVVRRDRYKPKKTLHLVHVRK